MANAYQPDFDADQERGGFAYRRAKLGQQAGSEKLGASLYEIPPGQATFPYHAHSANEEMLIVLSGQPHLRTPDGWRELAEGEVVAFRVGEDGAHQLQNRGAQHARVLVVSTMIAPEVNLYPDTGKLVAATGPPEPRARDSRRPTGESMRRTIGPMRSRQIRSRRAAPPAWLRAPRRMSPALSLRTRTAALVPGKRLARPTTVATWGAARGGPAGQPSPDDRA